MSYGEADINSILLAHLRSGDGAALRLRDECPNLVPTVEAFFKSRTDVGRLKTAQDVANIILAKHDLSDHAGIRKIVATQELRRLIRYHKQIDHTAHTVYLYLLGIWFYDNIPAVREAVEKIARKSRPLPTRASDITEQQYYIIIQLECMEFFLLQWVFASLLHDVGYVFYDLSNDTRKDRNKVDAIFSWSWLYKQAGKPSGSLYRALRKIYREFQSKYLTAMPTPTSKLSENAYEKVVTRLSSVPWIGELNKRWEGCDIFKILDINEAKKRRTRLQEFSREVAIYGYKGRRLRAGRCVDHAVASGLLLFQYSSYWYWIMNRLEKIVHRQSYKKVAGDFDYSVKNLLEIAFACRSVAYHNLLREVRGASSLLNEIKLDTDPITFLSIVCDELQKWDRFAAGASNLDDYTTYYEHSLESTDIELSATGIPSWPHAYYLVKNKTSKRKELIKTLNKRLRLQNWSLILTIDLDIERSLATQKALKKRRHNSG